VQQLIVVLDMFVIDGRKTRHLFQDIVEYVVVRQHRLLGAGRVITVVV